MHMRLGHTVSETEEMAALRNSVLREEPRKGEHVAWDSKSCQEEDDRAGCDGTQLGERR